jgi:hypothetical protein
MNAITNTSHDAHRASFANLTPGGTVPAEAGLLAALTAGGVSPGHAAIAVVVYRGVSWIVPALVGWVVFVALVGGGTIRARASREGERCGPREHARHARGLVTSARTTRLAHNLRHWHRDGDHAGRRR